MSPRRVRIHMNTLNHDIVQPVATLVIFVPNFVLPEMQWEIIMLDIIKLLKLLKSNNSFLFRMKAYLSFEVLFNWYITFGKTILFFKWTNKWVCWWSRFWTSGSVKYVHMKTQEKQIYMKCWGKACRICWVQLLHLWTPL